MKGNSAPSKNGMWDISRRAKYIFAVERRGEIQQVPHGERERVGPLNAEESSTVYTVFECEI